MTDQPTTEKDLEISDEHEPGVAHGCPEGCPVHCWGGPDVPDDTPYPAWATDAMDGIDTPGCDCGHDAMGPGWHISCAWRQQVRQRANEQQQAQDGPHAPHNGPERPDAGAETPDGPGGRQAGAEPPARLRRLRTQLAAEHAKAVRADQQPRPDLDHLRVTAHSGIAAGLETALFFVDHHLREAGEQAGRTTVNNPVARRDAADNPLREQYAAAIRGCAEEGNIRYGHVADAVLAVRDREMEQYAAAHLRDQAALTQIRLHIAVHRQRLGLADPVLLAKVEAVLREVGELEAAEGGGGA